MATYWLLANMYHNHGHITWFIEVIILNFNHAYQMLSNTGTYHGIIADIKPPGNPQFRPSWFFVAVRRVLVHAVRQGHRRRQAQGPGAALVQLHQAALHLEPGPAGRDGNGMGNLRNSWEMDMLWGIYRFL